MKLPALYFIETIVRDLHCDVELNTNTIHSGGLIVFSTLSNIILMLRIHALYNRSHKGEWLRGPKIYVLTVYCVVLVILALLLAGAPFRMFWEPLTHASCRPIYRMGLIIVVKSSLKKLRYSYTK